MRSKLNYLISVSLKRKIKTKWFMAANIILFIVILAALNIDSIITFFGGDFNDTMKIYVVDKADSFDIFSNQMQANSFNLTNDEEFGYELINYKEDKTAEDLIKEEKKKALVIVLEKKANVLEATITSQNFIDTLDYQVISNALTNTKVSLAILDSKISMEEINKIYEPINIARVILDENEKSEDEATSMIMSTVFPVIILPFFMLTLFLVQMIGAEVNDEKTTRGMEIIISNVSPKTHFFAKVIAGNLFVLIQGMLLVCFVVVGFLVRNIIGGASITNGVIDEFGGVINTVLASGLGSKLIYVVPLTLVLMLLTFLAYSLLAGILASMTTNTEDFQQLQTPIIIISLIGYYLSIMAGVFDGALFIKFFAFVPLISAILAPSLLIIGQIGVIEVSIAIIIMIVVNTLLIKYGLKIYKVGILNYSSKGLWKKMFKALKD